MPIWIRVVIFVGVVWVLLIINLAFMFIPTSVTKNGPPIITLDRSTIGTIAIFCSPPFVVVGLIRIIRGTLFDKTE